METKPNKELYEAPTIAVEELDAEGVICASGGEYHGFGEETPLT